MKFIEKNISQFIESQFPAIYREDGPVLIEFVKSYFEWMEQQDNTLFKTRRLFEYRDIDSTLDEYIVHFKNKYAVGLKLETEADKRLLLKNIQDLYKSKGSERSYEILFRALYNKDVSIYIPGDDILRVSDGEWVEGKFLEITSTANNIQDYIGKKITGVNSGATGIVENYSQRISNRKVVDILEISSVQGSFDFGESLFSGTNNNIIGINIPSTVGSLSAIGIIDGGANFEIGDILNVEGKGFGGKAKVVSTTRQLGRVTFELENGGTGYSLDALTQVFPKLQLQYSSNTGNIQNNQLIFQVNESNTIIANGIVTETNSSVITLKQYTSGFTNGSTVRTAINLIIDVASGTFSNGEVVYQANSSANVAVGTIVGIVPNVGNTSYYVSNVTGAFTTSVYSTGGNTFLLVGNTSSAQGFIYNVIGGSNTGTATVANIVGGGTGATFRIGDIIDKEIVTINTDYIRDRLDTKLLVFNEGLPATGTVATTSGSNTLTGTGTTFTTDLVVGDYIQVNTSTSKEVRQVSTIANNISLTVTENFSNTQSGVQYFKDQANYLFQKVSSIADIENLATTLTNALTYEEFEIGTISYLAGINPGTGYSLNPYVSVTEPLIAALEQPGVAGRYKGADAIVDAFAGTGQGIALATKIVDSGLGYEPGERVTLSSPDSSFSVTGAAVVSSEGRKEGYWKSTRGFLDSDKYIQDSKYYQEFSYELRSSVNFNEYKDVVLTMVHTAGTELFGKYIIYDNLDSTAEYMSSYITLT